MCVVRRGLQGGSINHGSRDLIELHITYQLLKVMGYCEVAVVSKKNILMFFFCQCAGPTCTNNFKKIVFQYYYRSVLVAQEMP